MLAGIRAPTLAGSMLQGRTVRFLAHLVQGPAAAASDALLGGMLRLALELVWWKMDPQVVLLAVPLVRRLAEAADAGAFASPDSPLTGLASTLACQLLAATGQPCPPVPASCRCLSSCRARCWDQTCRWLPIEVVIDVVVAEHAWGSQLAHPWMSTGIAGPVNCAAEPHRGEYSG
jgi:hypothetical protein